MMYRKIILLLLFGWLAVSSVSAQEENAIPQAQAPTAVRPVDETKWADATRSLDYSDDRYKERQRKPRNLPTNSAPSGRDWTLNTGLWGNVLQTIAIILAVLAIAFGIYKMMQQPRNKAIARDGVEITFDNLEDYLHETDLDRFLKQALADQNYALAIRVYYLQIIKDLSAKNAIHWSREKTNRDYLREMRQHPKASAFRDATQTFERVWYGNVNLTADTYRQIEPRFRQLLSNL